MIRNWLCYKCIHFLIVLVKVSWEDMLDEEEEENVSDQDTYRWQHIAIQVPLCNRGSVCTCECVHAAG